jgi:chorismate synthase
MGNLFGRIFRVAVFGESHGKVVGAFVDGCPAGIPIGESDIQADLNRRRPGFASFTTARKEEDKVNLMSGVFKGKTTGAPICMIITNRDARSLNYEKMKNLPRPGHADFTAFLKYGGFADYRGGGMFSGRMTAALVMAGAVAKKILEPRGVKIAAHITQIGNIHAKSASMGKIFKAAAGGNFPCADQAAGKIMLEAIAAVKRKGDSLGGIVECVVQNPPPGLGEPFFDTMEGDLAKGLFAIPAVKGVEFGLGFESASKTGSENNDQFIVKNRKIATSTNKSGGMLGGITNGMPLVFRVAIKPTPSHSLPQNTVNLKTMKEETFKVQGRHDPCIVPRVPPVVEAAAAIVLADHLLLNKTRLVHSE